MEALRRTVEGAIADFCEAAVLAGAKITPDVIRVEILERPHKAPSQLPRGKMAVYAFFQDGKALKVGKAGPNSHARYSYQHYNPRSAASTLAGSIYRDAAAVDLSDPDASEIGQWIRFNTDRVNLLLPADYGDATLSFLETFLHLRWQPLFEGRN